MLPGFSDSRSRFEEERKTRAGGGKDKWDDVLRKQDIMNFVEAFVMSQDGDDFPTRLACELQSIFWPQSSTEVDMPYT